MEAMEIYLPAIFPLVPPGENVLNSLLALNTIQEDLLHNLLQFAASSETLIISGPYEAPGT